jgi:hypothetical protein
LSRARLIARAEAICERFNAEIAAVAAKNTSVAEIERQVPRNAALELAALGELSKLTPPSTMAREWRAILGYRRALVGQLVELARAAKQSDARAISTLTAAKGREHELLLSAATHAGFRSCAAT